MKPASARAQPKPKYRRIVLKLSGEALKNSAGGDPIDSEILTRICRQLKEVHELGVQVGVVVGGGNIFRGLKGMTTQGTDRATGDYMGMLATVINGLALMDGLEKLGVEVRVMTAIPMDKIAEPYILRRALRHLERGRLVIFVAGTGNPYFSTDTTAALRASELGAQILIKATQVDGVYDRDPKKFPNAKKYATISYLDALRQRLNVMDSAAFSLCLDNHIPILVFNLSDPEGIRKAVLGQSTGTMVQ
jgi:uridylate kinase